MILHAYNCELTEIDLEENVASLEVERPEIFLRILEDLANASSPANEVSKKKKKGLLKASEIFCLSDFFSFSLDSHTLLGKIYKRFNDLLCDDFPLRLTVDEQLRLLRQHLENLVRSSTADFCFAEQIDYKDLFSALKISPLCLSDEIDQRLIQFLNLCSELNLYKAVVLIQPKAYISEEKLQKVYSCALANRIGLVVLECVCRKNVLKHEKKICILRDFSDIII